MTPPLRALLLSLVGGWGLLAASLWAYSLISASRARRVGEMVDDPIIWAILIFIPLIFGLVRYRSQVKSNNG